jgi:sterol 3beta-glucosyltransferase
MRITIFAAGSRGDIQPCVVLARGLQQAGFDVLLAAPENFADFVQAHGLNFHPLRGDVQQIMAGETGREFMQGGNTNPIQSIRAMRSMLEPVALQMAEDALEACQGADALISLAVFATLAKTIAEIRQIPLIHVEPTPVFPTRSFTAPGWPLQKNLGGFYNRFSGHAMLRVLWLWYAPFVNAFRARFDLPPYRAASFYQILTSAPLLGAYSDQVIPRPPDWPENIQISGYLFLDSQSGWGPDHELMSFLDGGDPPVYIGFGSMSGRNPERLAALVLEALAKSGQRGLLLTGWGGMQTLSVPENVYVLDAAPHSWLFPRMAAVVHHGGAGTTAEGLRAGVPALILPFAVDQAFWGKRVQNLGVGPEPIPQKKLTADSLAHAIQLAVTLPDIRLRAARLGEALRAEDGLGNAVSIISH